MPRLTDKPKKSWSERLADALKSVKCDINQDKAKKVLESDIRVAYIGRNRKRK